jgi:hypothetical protein
VAIFPHLCQQLSSLQNSIDRVIMSDNISINDEHCEYRMHPNYQQKHNRHIHKYKITMFVLALFFLNQCTLPTQKETIWKYIIPDGYQGYLAIHYECPGGKPLSRSDNMITVEFNDDGIYCTSESAFATRGPLPITVTTTGRDIPYVTDPWNHSGWGICCGSTRAIGGNTVENPNEDLILGLQWVGQMQPRPRSAPEVPEPFHQFAQEQFGLRDINEFLSPTP